MWSFSADCFFFVNALLKKKGCFSRLSICRRRRRRRLIGKPKPSFLPSSIYGCWDGGNTLHTNAARFVVSSEPRRTGLLIFWKSFSACRRCRLAGFVAALICPCLPASNIELNKHTPHKIPRTAPTHNTTNTKKKPHTKQSATKQQLASHRALWDWRMEYGRM